MGFCIPLQPTRAKLHKFTHKYCSDKPMITSLVTEFCDQSSHDFCQFIFNCSAISKVQVFTSKKEILVIFNHMFHITRPWVYTLHKAHLKILLDGTLSELSVIPITISLAQLATFVAACKLVYIYIPI